MFTGKNNSIFLLVTILLLIPTAPGISSSVNFSVDTGPIVRFERNGHYYQTINLALPWHEARDYCSGLDGYLVTISSLEENQFVYEMGGGWLGATDEASEGIWAWVSGEPWGFENWAPGEPNNCCPPEYCGGDGCSPENYLNFWGDPYNGEWNDVPNGDSTFICEWETEPPTNPTFSANLTENTISDMWEWPDGAVLTLTIDHPGTPKSPDYTETKIYYPDNATRFVLGAFRLQIGDLVTLTDGNTTKSTTVANVSITEINVENDTISGTADPFTAVEVKVWAAGLSRFVQADENGNWLADFSVPGSQDNEGQTYDIHAGDNGRVRIDDDDGDRTTEYYHVNYTLTRIEAYPDMDRIGGGQWPLGATVTIEIDDPVTPQNPDYIDNVMVGMTEDPFQTWFDMDINGYDLKTGDVITAMDGTSIKQLIVGNLMITAFDLDADMVYGVAEPNQTGDVFVGNRQGGSRYLTADQEGNWSANFAVPGDWDGEWEIVDLHPGSRIISSFYDEDVDATVYDRTAGSTIYGTVYLIAPAPENVMAGVLIEACTSENFCRIDLTDWSGNYRLNGLPAGIYNIRAIPPGTNLPGNLGPIDISSDEILYGQDIIVPEPPLPPPQMQSSLHTQAEAR